MKMNLANKLTIFRILLVPVIMLIPIIDNLVGIPGEFLGISTAFWIMNIIFIVASITDKLDGYIARSRNQVTTFGKFLDPLADKILVLSALVILVEYGKIPSWIPIIVLARVKEIQALLSFLIATIGLAFGLSGFLQQYLLYKFENEEY